MNKEKTFIIFLFVVFVSIIYGIFHKFNEYGETIQELKKTVDSYKIQSSTSDVIYIPGKVCIMNTEQKVSEEDLRKYMASCLYSHKKWLNIDLVEEEQDIYE